MLRNKPSSKQSGPTTLYGRPIVYDREIFISICRKILLGEDLQTICAKPPMPIGAVFLGWIEDHREARAIYRSVENFRSDRRLGKELDVIPARASVAAWEEQVRDNCDRGWPADYIERKYIPPDWNKVYPLLGRPPVWSTEDMQAYNDLINGFTEMLEPRDMMELMLAKEVTDATWEASRKAREKNCLPERKYQQRLKVSAELQMRRGAPETTAAKPATALDHSLGLEAGFKYYQALDIAQSRALKRRDNALRQIARWRDGLGAKARHLSDKFIAEQALAERYGAAQFLADTQTDDTAGDGMQAAPPLASAGDTADAAPPVPLADEAAEAAAALASGDKAAENAPPPAPTDAAAEAAPPLPMPDEAARTAPALAPSGETAETAPPLRASDAAVDAAPPLAPGGEAAWDAPPPAPTGEGADAAPRGAPPDEAAEAAPPRTPAREVDIDMDSRTERINWVGWLTGAERYTWVALSKGAHKDFKQPLASKKWLVHNLVVDRKVIRPDQVCPELAQFLPAIAEAAPTVAASAEAPK
jgi:hypothetical protein